MAGGVSGGQVMSWLGGRGELSVASREAYLSDVKIFKEWLGSGELDELVLARYRDHMVGEGRSAATVRRHLGSVGAFLSWLEGRGECGEVYRVGGPRVEPREVLAIGEVEGLLGRVGVPERHVRGWALSWLIYETGWGLGRVLGLDMGLDVEVRGVDVRVFSPEGWLRSGEERRGVSVSAGCVRALASYVAESGKWRRRALERGEGGGSWLMVNRRGGKLTRAGAWGDVKRYGRWGGVEGLTPRSLGVSVRRSYGRA